VVIGHHRRGDLPAMTQSILALRWLVLAMLIALEAATPASTPTSVAVPLYSGALMYSLALTVFAWRYPARTEAVVGMLLIGDTILDWIGMWFTAFPWPFLFLTFPLAVIAGLSTGYVGASGVVVVLALAQSPVAHASLFAPAQWLPWGVMAISLLCAGTASAAASERLAERAGFAHTLVEIRNTGESSTQAADAAEAVLRAAAAQFRADSGSLMLFNPQSRHLEMLATHGLDDPYRQIWAQTGEGIARWVAQGGHAILLTPGATIPFPLPRREIGSSMCVPVTIDRKTLGVLNLNRPVAGPPFSRADLETAEIVAHHLAGLLMHAQHERTVPALVTELASGHAKVGSVLTRDPGMLWPALLDLVRSVTAAPFAVLALEHEDTGNVGIVAARGIDGAAARDLLPALLAATARGEIYSTNGSEEVPRSSSVSCVPLSVDSRTIGALGIGLPGDALSVRPLLQAVAAHVAAAVGTAVIAHRVADIGAVEERRRIAREMHDGLAQTVADALLQTDLVGMTAQSAPDHLNAEVKELRALLERAMRELREFMADLRREKPQEHRLVSALEALAKEFERRSPLQISVVGTGDDAKVPPTVRHALVAIARQALANVHAHAQATSVTIRAETADAQCAVSIADNGVGFDLPAYQASARAGHHLGLTSMDERASLVGGRLQIDTAPNRGTTVTVRIPLGGDPG
jgi:signal transduction histidine kinase